MDYLDQPSYWLTGDFSDETFDKLDSMFYRGELTGMDAGDVFSLAAEMESEAAEMESEAV